MASVAGCHRDLQQYDEAIQNYQVSARIHQALDHIESFAIRLTNWLISSAFRLQKSSNHINPLVQEAHGKLQQAIQIDTTGDYLEHLAYDAIILALLTAEQLRWLPPEDATIPTHIAQFEQSTTDAFTRFTQLGHTVNSAEEALDIARAYLEIPPLQNLAQAETLARQSLETFQTFNRRKLRAAAYRLLGEIYTAQRSNPDAISTAQTFFIQSRNLYRDLDIENKALEVEQLLQSLK